MKSHLESGHLGNGRNSADQLDKVDEVNELDEVDEPGDEFEVGVVAQEVTELDEVSHDQDQAGLEPTSSSCQDRTTIAQQDDFT